jgi:hypothetical protein
MSDVAEIARGLTKAQRRALIHAPDDCEWMGRGNLGGFKLSFAAMDRPDLGKPQLCEVATDITGIFDARLTPLGLAVRAHLENNP